MPVVTAAVTAVTAAIAAPTLATVAGAAIAVGTAVGTVGLGLNVIGGITGNKSLQKIGGTMSLVGGVVGLGAGIVGGGAAYKFAQEHLSNAWNDGIGQLFSDGPKVANEVAGASKQGVKYSELPGAPTGKPDAVVGPGGQVPGQPPPATPPHTPAPVPTPKSEGWWDQLTTSDKLALGLAGGQAVMGGIEGYVTGQHMAEENQIRREALEHGGPNAPSPGIVLSTPRRRRERIREGVPR